MSLEHFGAILDCVGDPVFVKDEQYRYVLANDAFYTLTGTPREWLLGKTDYDFFPEDQAAVIRKQDESVFETGNRIVNEDAFIDAQGNIRIATTDKALYTDTAGGRYVVGTIRDVSDRRRAEEALEQANLVVEKSPVVLFRWKAEEGWPVTVVSRNVIQFGYTAEELLSGEVRFASMVHPEDLDRVTREVQEYSDAGADGFRQEYRIVTKDGGVRWVDDRTVVERGPDGQIVFYQGIIIDITERKEAEANLAHSHDLMRHVIEHTNSAVAIYDREFRYIYASRRYLDDYRVGERDVVGKHHHEVFPAAPQKWWDAHRRALKGEVCGSDRDLYYDEDGRVDWVRWECRPWYEAAGTIGGVIDYTEIITERVRTEEALEKRIVALTQPLDDIESITFEDLFSLSDIQRLQDLFADAWGVAALITRPDGTPITQPSNFTYFCSEFIRKTEKGLGNCQISDAALGRHDPSGPIIHTCLSAGLWGAGASITIGGRHIASWLIGQVRNEAQTEERIMEYARVIGADEAAFREAFLQVPVMPQKTFEKIALSLFALANQLSNIAYQNIQQARFITERKRAEEALRESERKLHEAQTMAQLGHWTWDVRTGEVEWSEEVFKVFHLDPHSFTPRIDSILALSPWPEDHERDNELIRRAMESHEKGTYEQRFLRPDKSIGHYVSSFQGKYDDGGNLVSIVGTVQDITERKNAEERLKQSEEKLKEAQRIAHLGNWELDLASNRLQWSDAIYGIFEIDPMEFGASYEAFLDAIHPDDREMVDHAYRESLKNKTPYEITHRLLMKDGRIKWVSEICRTEYDKRGNPTKSFGVVQDITERKRIEEELVRAQKLESLGILAGGIAHDFNNLLMGVLGNIELAMMGLPADHPSYPLLKAALHAAGQTGDLTGRLITFAKGGFLLKHARDLSTILRTAVMKSIGGTAVRVAFEIEEDLWPVEVDETQIRQVFHNLTVNAVEAMPDGGTLTIRAKNTEIRDIKTLPLREGRYLGIVFADTGRGIGEQDLSRIYEPYFTTKNMGDQKGMGLGLSVCYSVLKNHDGYITVASQQGKGAVFTLYLPALTEKTRPEEKGGETTRRRVLVMEDENRVREMERAFLERLGYEVTEAKDGREAIDRYRESLLSQNPFDLVILALVVRRGLGAQLTLEALLKEDPSVRAILVSGYMDEPVIEHYGEYGFRGVLKKPFRFGQFEKTVKTVINAEA
jgi:two-component system, cell cycle sensor histidine kinase and response regulator CckA